MSLALPTIVPISEAKSRLAQLVDEAQTDDVVLTRHGRAAAVLIAAARYNALVTSATAGTADIEADDYARRFRVESAGHSPEAIDAIGFGDGALALAGHSVTDPVLRQLRWDAADGVISTEEAIRRGVAHIRARRPS